MLAGCATTPNGERDIAPAIRTAAYMGTAYALVEHPDWRDEFEQAVIDLKVVEEAPKLDVGSVLPVIGRFTFGGNDSKYVILFTGAYVLLSDYAGSLTPEQTEKLRPSVVALREGIELGMGPKPANVRKVKI
jgi:hypothetical protein